MNRRKFIKTSFIAAGTASMLSACNDRRKIKGEIIGASASVGHLLRDKKFQSPSEITKTSVVIIGAGVSGLSAARQLFHSGITDFILLDLEKHTGGNASYGSNAVSAYPWGAHYIPVPNNELSDYLDFLKECNVVTGYNESGLPIYNELFLCFDPQERLYINGRWQDGLIPEFGVPEDELNQIKKFLGLMNDMRYKKGRDGKDAFAIPVDDSSKDPEFTALDTITMEQWLRDKGFTSSYLHWYVNYCTRDDFGASHSLASAWSGIHYFAARKGKGANAEHADVITWPEGNGFLVKHLQKDIQKQIRIGCMATAINSSESELRIEYFDTNDNKLKAFEAAQCIVAVPQFIAARLLKDENRQSLVKKNYHYTPWLVANFSSNTLEERSGVPQSWDNVIYESNSLGYVEATHQFTDQIMPVKNFTYYMPLTDGDPVKARKSIQQKTHEELVNAIIDDLVKVHPNIRESINEMNITIWGHAMVQPRIGMIHGDVRQQLGASLFNKIHFANTDIAGVSIFEEGFYKGITAAKRVIDNL